MRNLTEEISIRADDDALWSVLEDFGGVSDWAPYMRQSELIGKKQTGVGTCRTMRHAWGFCFEETVTEWTEGKGYSFDVYRAPFPMNNVHETWQAGRKNGRATVVTNVHYDMCLGFVGRLLDWVLVRHIVKREMRTGLRGLQKHVERKSANTSSIQFAD